MRTWRDRKLAQMASKAREDEPTLYIGLVTEEGDTGYSVTVNGRSESRQAVASNEFTFESAGTGKGDEVLLLASPTEDRAQIIGLSPWSVNG